MRTLRGILIDPLKQEVKEVEVQEEETGLLIPIYKLLDCDMVQVVYFKRTKEDFTNVIIVDEEGRMKDQNMIGFRINIPELSHYTYDFVGKALILGDTSIDWVATDLPLNYIKDNTIFGLALTL